ncbi:MAG TPA: hypothetical protein VFQ23_04200, partial [Anaerolineales bacterium]|nr:hypothetical protein [Anaerolineales bacterium]
MMVQKSDFPVIEGMRCLWSMLNFSRICSILAGFALLILPTPSMKARVLILPSILWLVSCLPGTAPVANSPALHPTGFNTQAPPNASPTAPHLVTTGEPMPTPSTGWFELVGHSPLLERGMNAGLAVHGSYAYVGSRTDGRHANAGVLVVDISNLANPQVIYQIGSPEEALVGQTSRELRVWPEQELLLVMNVDCGAVLHDCGQPVTSPNLNIYDISGANAALPKLILTFPLGRTPHEMFLWDDPQVDGRALLYLSTFGAAIDKLFILDISQARNGVISEVGAWSPPFGSSHSGLHSLSLSVDGRRGYLAHDEDGFMILDTSQYADALPNPQASLMTPPENWAKSPVGAHSAVKLFGKPYALITEEVYGLCPWGWTYLIDITDESRPFFVSEYKLFPYNTIEHCAGTTYEQNRYTSFSSHNPTL